MIAFIAEHLHVICFALLGLLIVCQVIKSAVLRRREAAEIAAFEQYERERAQDRAAAKQRAEQQRAAAEAERKRRAAEREAARQAKQAARLEAARELAELKERALNAEKALRALKAQPAAPAPCDARESSCDEDGILTLTPDEFAERLAQLGAPSYRPLFAGETVSFTGTIPDIPRREAMRLTKLAGGAAYPHINTHCTLLVVGEGAECNHSRDAADRWNVREMTWQTWKRTIETAAA